MTARWTLLVLLCCLTGARPGQPASAPAGPESNGAAPAPTKSLLAPNTFPDLAYNPPLPADRAGSSLLPGGLEWDGGEVREEYVDEVTGIVLVRVPGGAFYMGCDALGSERREQPVHLVSLSDFWMAEHEVTRRQWELVMGEEPAVPENRDHPVTGVTWNEAAAFAEELASVSGLGYRLPTEAEWEYAAREGGRGCVWSGTSEIWELPSYAWYAANSSGGAHPVGSRLPNALGLYDLSGNVREWCRDWYGPAYYATSETHDLQGPPTGIKRVLRGGSGDNPARDCRAAFRLGYPPEVSSAYIGFRVVLSNP